MKKQSLIKGTLILGLAGIFAKFLGIFFRWPLQMLIGDEGVGYYQLSYPLYMFFIAVASGIPIAVSKMVSERNAQGDSNGSFQVLRKALLLMVIIGGGFSLTMITCSKQLVSFFKWDQKSIYSLMAISAAPIFISVMSVYRGFFQGLQDMTPTAISQVLEQAGRIVVGISLVYILLPKGIEYSAAGAAFGACAGGIIALIYLFILYNNYKNKMYIKSVKRKDTMDILIKTAVPISIGASVGSIMNLIDSALVPMKLYQAGFTHKEATILFAQLSGKAAVLINVPLTLSMALCYSIVPVIAESFVLNRKNSVQVLVSSSIKLSSCIAFPTFLGLYIFPQQVLSFIFRGQNSGAEILKYLSFSIPFLILTQSTTAVLQAIGRFREPVFNLLIGCIVKTVLVMYLVKIPEINIHGAVIGTIFAYIITMILNFITLYKNLKIKLDLNQVIIKPLLASSVMILSVEFIYLNVYNYTKSNDISLGLTVMAGIIIYTFLIIILRVFSYQDIKGRIKRR